MSLSLAEIFRSQPDLDSFRTAVLALEGDFPLDSDGLIDLGQAYFERFPDRAQDRNAAEVLLGYAVARVVLIEKAVLAVPAERRAAFRAMLSDVGRVGPLIEAVRAPAGEAALGSDLEALRAALDALKEVIDEIPKSLVKERFVGGISNLYNILYVIRLKLRGPLQ